MSREKKYEPKEIIPKLRNAEVLMSQRMTQDLAAKRIGNSTQTRFCWRKKYGGLLMDQAKRLKKLEQGIARLKQFLADAARDKASWKEVASKNFEAQ